MAESNVQMSVSPDSAPYMTRDFEFSLDAQGRVAIPADWRMGGKRNVFMLIPGLGETIQLLPLDVYEERIMSKIKKLSLARPDDLRKARALGKNTYKVECDKQGRVQLDARLIAYAKLEKRVALIGSGDFAQIMSAERWHAEDEGQGVSSDAFLDILE